MNDDADGWKIRTFFDAAFPRGLREAHSPQAKLLFVTFTHIVRVLLVPMAVYFSIRSENSPQIAKQSQKNRKISNIGGYIWQNSPAAQNENPNSLTFKFSYFRALELSWERKSKILLLSNSLTFGWAPVVYIRTGFLGDQCNGTLFQSPNIIWKVLCQPTVPIGIGTTSLYSLGSPEGSTKKSRHLRVCLGIDDARISSYLWENCLTVHVRVLFRK